MTTTTKSWWIDLCLLAVLTSVLYGLFLGLRPLAPPDEGRYSEIPREMVLSHDYLTPRLDGAQYFEKPALFYWLQAVSIKFFGLHEWSLRLMNALMGGLGCLLTYLGARALYGRRIGLLSGMLLSSATLYAALSRFITLDITMATLVTASLLSFILGNEYPPGKIRRYFMWSMYLFAALATLTKGLIGILFPGMIIFTWLLMTNQWRNLKSYCLLSGTVIFLAVTLPWHILVGLKNPGFFHFYFYEQHFLRYFTNYAGRGQAFWFLPVIFLVGWFPWIGFVIPAMKQQFSVIKKPRQNPTELYLLIWPILIFVFYWISHSQLSPYLLPIFPPIAIITARYLNSMWDKKTKSLKLGFLFAGLINVLFCIALLLFLKKSKAQISIILTSMIVATSMLNALLSNIIYERHGLKKALITLLLTNTLFFLTANYASAQFEVNSVKPIALTLKKILRPGDAVYNYNRYFQDMPVYLEQTVKLLNWKGELQYGSTHNPPPDMFLHEKILWENWSKPERKFVLMHLRDLKDVKTLYKDYTFYPIAQTTRYVLVCNKDIKK